MIKKHLGFFIKTAIAAAVFLIINLLIYKIPGIGIQTTNFAYPLPVVYLFFFLFSIIILVVLAVVNDKNESQLGYAFLGLTALKMAVSYAFAKPIIAKSIENPTEKVNFLAVFILFLAIEAYFTARLLNNK